MEPAGPKTGRNPLSLPGLLRSLPRAVDRRPIWAQLNVTWRCNLDCAYCTEYDNDKGDVPYDDLVARIERAASSASSTPISSAASRFCIRTWFVSSSRSPRAG